MIKLDCKDTGELKEYIRCKIECKENEIKLMQPTLVQKLGDTFEILSKHYILCLCCIELT